MRHPNGYGSITKLSGKRRNPWMVRITVGQREDTYEYVRKVLGYYPTRKDAMAALADYNKDPFDLLAEKPTFEEIFSRWSETEHFRNLSKSLQKQYAVAFRHSEPLYKVPLADLRLRNLQLVMDQSGLAYPSRNLLKTLWSQLFEFATRYEIVKENPVPRVDLGEREQKEQIHKPFTPEEINQLWKFSDRENVDLVLILIYTGMRISEAFTMKVENIHLDEGYMIGGVKTQAGKNRMIPIHHRIAPLIETRINPERGTLFPKTSQSKMGALFSSGVQGAGLSQHLSHDCRHTFASRMDSAGVNIRITKAILGHTGGDVTDKVYIHKTLEEMRKAVELLE